MEKLTKVCPKCGGTNVKTANILDTSEGFTAHTVGTALDEIKCEDCGYVGTCPSVKDVKEFRKEINK